jgi:hypothetical protein
MFLHISFDAIGGGRWYWWSNCVIFHLRGKCIILSLIFEDRHLICIVCKIWFNIGPILTYLIINEKITWPEKTNPIISVCWKRKPWIVAKTLWKTIQKLGYEHANDHCIGLVILHPHMDVPLLMAILNSGYTLAMSPWFTIGYLSTFIEILQG